MKHIFLEEKMRYSEEEKRMWLEDWRGSGKSAWAYAHENGLNPQTFDKWTKQNTATAAACFVEVSAPIIPPVRYTSEILIEKGDVKIHIPIELGRGELRGVMEGLGCVL